MGRGPAMTESRFSLTWDNTWQSRKQDFSAFDGDLLVGRVYLVLDAQESGQWHWGIHTTIGGHVCNAAGFTEDLQAARRLVEEDYRLFHLRIGADSK